MNINEERQRRWRLILGQDASNSDMELSQADIIIDRSLTALYGPDRGGGLGRSIPAIARWLGDIRDYFPKSVVSVMQKDAFERLDLKSLLLEPEFLTSVEPDINLVANLLSLSSIMTAKTKETARIVVRRIVEEIERKLAEQIRQAVTGSLNRASRNTRPKVREIDWGRTIKANLKHYQPEYKSVIPHTLIGYGHKRSSLRDIILCVDQSGSMASSVVYASIFGAILASLRTIKTHMVVFDTSVVDLTDNLDDPVELLFGIQLGGGTDISRALTYCKSLVQKPDDTILFLISDLYDGEGLDQLIKTVASIVSSGVQVITLLALDDKGTPGYDHSTAVAFASLGIPSFACTPDMFPDLLASTIGQNDISQWAATNNIVTASGK